MSQRPAPAVITSLVNHHRNLKRRSGSLTRLLPALVVCVLLVGTMHLGLAAVTAGGSTVGLRPKVSPMSTGQVTNSSVCRHALQRVSGHAAKCNVSRDFRGCRFDSGFISYLEFQYCHFSSPIVPTIVMVLWLFVLLAAFAVIADSFFSPSLIALARSMHMSQNLAGVTLLAFGNGAPDVFSAVTAITTGHPEEPDEGLGLGFLMGSGLLVNTVTAGLIMIIRPFVTNRRPFLKDTLFYMGAVCWSAAILVRRMIYLSDSIGFIGLYILYVLTTWVAGRVRVKKSNTPIYKQYAGYLRRLKDYLTCPQNERPNDEITDGEYKVTLKRRCTQWFGKCFQGDDKKKSCDVNVSDDVAAVVDPEPNPVKGTSSSGNQSRLPRIDVDVRFIGFRKKADPMSISKADSSNGHLRSPLCFPRIEITAPATEDGSSRFSRSSSKPTPDNPTHSSPKRDLLEPPQKQPVFYSLTPPTMSLSKASNSSFQGGLTPSSAISRRDSRSLTAASSVRKRSSVGGIGLRTRTPSIFQKRESRQTSAMEQLPFVVRWIIANEEAEGKGYEHGGHPYMEETSRETHLKYHKRRFRHISDSTRTPEISSIHTITQDHSQSHSPTFLDEHSSRHRIPHFSMFPHRRADCGLPRISSVSLPNLDQIGSVGVQYDASGDARSTVDMERGDVREGGGTVGDSAVEEKDGGSDVYMNAFVQWASRSMWHHLLYCLCPIDVSEWSNLSIPVKLIQIVQAPMFIIFRITIPVVYEDLEPSQASLLEIELVNEDGNSDSLEEEIERDHDNSDLKRKPGSVEDSEKTNSCLGLTLMDFEDLHGWCRLLNCFQCLLTPMLWVLLITVGGSPLGLYKIGESNLPVVVIVLLISTGLAIAIFVTSRWDKAPTPYHRPFFSTLGFLTSIVWIYAIAHELVNSLEALGIVFNISEAILGITVMAFASSISDLMSNSLLAHNGYPRIAFAACIGSPLFNLLIGAGVSYTIKLARSGDHNAAMSFTLTHALLFSFLLGVLTTNVIVAVATGFEMRRTYGIVLLVGYALFMVFAILIEADVILPPSWWQMHTGTE